ncbi:hypothetical protein WJX77_001982 [Trebouxia sp. C0004]
MSTAFQDQQSSTSLASRPSFFGGFVSTRQASALPSWKPSKPAEGVAGKASGQSVLSKASAASTAKTVVQPNTVPTPPLDPTVVRKERLKASRNFDSDSDTEPDKQRSRESRNLSKLEQRVAAAEKDAAAKRRAPEAQRALLLQQQYQQQAYQSPYNSSGKPVASKGRTVLPKGKAGAASRNMALAPQAIALSRKQMADRGIRQAVDSVRSQAPTFISSQRQQSNATAGPFGKSSHAMPSTSGRHRQPLSSHSSSAPAASSTTHRLNGSGLTAHRHMTDSSSHMPAWAQKAKQAVLAGRGAKRMRPEEHEYEDDFVVDDEEEPDWRQALKSITKYDPSKFDDRGFDDRTMEANYKQIQAEERRSARLGREDDRRAEEEELREQEEKRKKRKRARATGGLVT